MVPPTLAVMLALVVARGIVAPFTVNLAVDRANVGAGPAQRPGEAEANARGLDLATADEAEVDALWEQAKSRVASGRASRTAASTAWSTRSPPRLRHDDEPRSTRPPLQR